MGFLDLFDNSAPTERIKLRLENETLHEELNTLHGELREVQEDLLRISDAFDRRGTEAIGVPEGDSTEIPLRLVKKVSELSRSLNMMNPFVKRGVEARMGYIWGKGVSFDGVDGIKTELSRNRKKLFSPQAYEELERVLATDGNAFTAIPIPGSPEEGETAFRVPLDNIEGAISNPKDKEEIWYYKVEEHSTVTNGKTGEQEERKVTKFYASLNYYNKLEAQGKNLPRRWGKFGVEQNYVLHHTAVNKQVGWRWGVPDIMPVIFWAMAYKEYLEDNAQLVKAYSRLAWQIKPSSAAGAQAAAAQVMAPPTRDPITGQLKNVGGTAINGLGGELTPIAANGSTVDFSKGSPLASAIASGLEVSLVVITSDPGSGNRATAETLDLPTLKAMEKRQQLHSERFLEIFEFWGAAVDAYGESEITEAEDEGKGVEFAIVTWPQIQSDSTKDRVAAIVQATTDAHLLYPEEARKELIDVFGIAPFKPWDEVPKPEDDPYKVYEREQSELGFEREQAAADKVVASQGNSGGVASKGGAMNTANQSRDNRDADTGNS